MVDADLWIASGGKRLLVGLDDAQRSRRHCVNERKGWPFTVAEPGSRHRAKGNGRKVLTAQIGPEDLAVIGLP
jgi:hypothetical protein